MSDVDSFVSPRPTDEFFQSRIRQSASVALWQMMQRVEMQPGDKVSLALTVETAKGVIVDRRSFVTPSRLEK
jgi:hypothetical protein